MTIAPDREALESRIADFLWKRGDPRNESLRDILAVRFGKFERVAIVGGMPRDFALGRHAGFTSDVDLVIDEPVGIVADLAAELGARTNSFGGHSVHLGGWKVDFWALETTWAARAGHVGVSRVEDLLRCTFFDCDAVLYDLKAHTVSCRSSYFDDLRGETIEINLEPTPAIHGNLYRAVRRIIEWNFQAGPRLSAFIETHLDERGFQSILRQDAALNPDPFTRDFGDVTGLRERALRKAR